MAASTFPSEQYMSEDFVESAGAILFKLSTKQVLVSHQHEWDQYLLAKGRRNIGESRHAAALRELREETGYNCRPLPVNLVTRCTPVVEHERSDDRARYYTQVNEPFALQTRKFKDGGIKLIWWYTAALKEDQPRAEIVDKELEKATCDWYSYDYAVEKLTFLTDRDILRRAIKLVEETYNGRDIAQVTASNVPDREHADASSKRNSGYRGDLPEDKRYAINKASSVSKKRSSSVEVEYEAGLIPSTRTSVL